jgi:dTDP-D-glucose 4,6-dehydratase
MEEGVINEIYNIGTDCEKTVMDVAALLVKHMTPNNDNDIANHITYVPDRPFNDFRYAIDSSRLRELGWSERHTDFEANIRSLIHAKSDTE